MQYTLFDTEGCQVSGRSIPPNSEYILSHLNFDRAPDGGNLAEVSLSIDPETMTTSPIYKEIDKTRAEILFCVRFSVCTGNASDPDSIEVNFIETPVKMQVLLKDGFYVDVNANA